MKNNVSVIAFCWQSKSLTGAQWRFLSIVQKLNELGHPAIILLEKKDARSVESIYGGSVPYLISFTWPWWMRLFGYGYHRFPRLWKIIGMRYLLHYLNNSFLNKLREKYNICLWHVSMSTQLANSVPGPALFEVTSPDWADKIRNDIDAVPKNMPLHAVSGSVYNLLMKTLSERNIILSSLLFPKFEPKDFQEINFSKKNNLIVFAHRFIARKNGVLFAYAVKKFLKRNPDWKVSFRGEGPEENKVREILSEEISSQKVLVGYIRDLHKELTLSRIFVSLIEPDNYPSQSVVEAMTCGNAVLLSDTGHSSSFFYDENGCLVELNESSILGGLESLVSDIQSLNNMGKRSRFLAETRFSQEKYIEHLLKVYQGLGVSVDY